MIVKDIISLLEKLDPNKHLVIIGTDGTDWEYGQVIDETTITEEEVYPSEDNGLINDLGDPDETGVDFVSCYVVRMDC